MKNRLFILFTALAFGLCSSALAQDFNTGSSLMNTGSTLSSTVYGVGASSVDPMATTTSTRPMRFATMDEGEDEEGRPGAGDYTPIGAPYIMLLFAAAAAGVVALRRRRIIER